MALHIDHRDQFPISAWAEKQLYLLDKEQEAEANSSKLAGTAASVSPSTRRTLQAAGYALTGLVLSQCRTGMGGRVVGEFTPDPAISSAGTDEKLRLGSHGIRVGDVVRVNTVTSGAAKNKDKEKSGDGAKDGPEGVVTRVSDKGVWIAFGQKGMGRPKDEDEAIEQLWSKKLWILKLANDVTYRRMKQTMTKLKEMKQEAYTNFIEIAFGHSSTSRPEYNLDDVQFVDPSLNDSQKHAICFALASKDLALIHGPPGTGKTHTLIELILQLVQRKQRVLVCGPSNISVDNIVERLAPTKVPVVRIGHPARLLPSVLDHSLEVLTQTSDAGGIVKDVRKEIDAKQASIRKTKTGRERKAIYNDLKSLRQEFRERESKCVHDLVRESSVALATLHGAGGHQLKQQQFDVVIIDEASQALEAQCWIPLISAKKVILAGDHLQLPPTVKFKDPVKGAKKSNGKETKDNESANPEDNKWTKDVSLETTLFDRLLSMHGSEVKTMLTTQYRMHEKIMNFPSDQLYESKLIAAEAVKARLLIDLPYEVEDTDDTREPLVLWDTQGGDFPEKTETDDIGKKEALLGESKSNEMEAMVVARHVDNLVDAGVHPEDIAVITPYNGQLAVLSQKLREKYPDLELGSVDGFQGREKEAIVVSLVRSNDEQEVGFLRDKRRLNVAMTRPKRHLCVCGDSETLSRSGVKFLKDWMGFLEEHADLRYPDAGELLQSSV
ncbi:DNA helicase [Penicillium riverlandense]|uniref:DNA helicase n=1 Tax=Penicillium riverlandense TaxID=1903569 RepID=UPI002546D985|nr:DNA helicase [Penicillium riverlandense]KAJ5819927.1 DNA helicase [Penicillium riverlandense]